MPVYSTAFAGTHSACPWRDGPGSVDLEPGCLVLHLGGLPILIWSVGVLASRCYQTLCGSDAWSCLAMWPGPKSLEDHSRALQACISPAPKNWRRRPGRPRHTWLRTVEEDLRQFNIGLASGLRRAQNRTGWRTLTGTATSPTSSDWWWIWSHIQALTGTSVE